jgi:RNase adaptor protein for sRNA GlmZ degradation
MADDHGAKTIGGEEGTAKLVTPLTIEITSFSYKKELPPHLFSHDGGRHGGGFIFDCRSLPNPGREPAFKTQTGLDRGVIEYLERLPEVMQFSHHVHELVTLAVRNFLERNFEFMSVGFGCTGGQHRSVFFCERTAEYLRRTFQGAVVPCIRHHNLAAMGLLPSSVSNEAQAKKE